MPLLLLIRRIYKKWFLKKGTSKGFQAFILLIIAILILFALREVIHLGTRIWSWTQSTKTKEGFTSTAQQPVSPEYMKTLEEHQKKGMFPFRWLKDENGKILPIVLVSGFFRDDEAKQRYQEYIDNGVKVVGITAYKTFPKKIEDASEDKYHHTDTFDYIKEIKNWMVCFKDSQNYGFTSENNIIDISESDFYDVDTDAIPAKKYDIIYVCLKDNDKCPLDGWNAINRNYELALKCIPTMIIEYGLKVLVVGRIGCGLEEEYGKDNIETTDFLPWHEFQEKIRQSRILFVPNVMDASPRVIAESMIKGLPVIMNQNIVCGSKYITPDTGVLFNDESDFPTALSQILDNYPKISPKKVQDWWTEHYGTKRSAERMCDFLAGCYPDLLDQVQEVSFYL
jgi:glycosyltransferase involved in cell wall biosynthesis